MAGSSRVGWKAALASGAELRHMVQIRGWGGQETHLPRRERVPEPRKKPRSIPGGCTEGSFLSEALSWASGEPTYYPEAEPAPVIQVTHADPCFLLRAQLITSEEPRPTQSESLGG